MFVSHDTVLGVGFPAARAGLAALAQGGWLREASGQAYADSLVGLARVGPFGELAGASKLVRVSLLEPIQREDSMVLPLRWEATGVMGRLFPVLDANLMLSPAGDGSTRLTFTGAYRPPLAAVGSGIDRMLLHRAASATVRSLVRTIADRIVAGPAADGAAGQAADGAAGQAADGAAGQAAASAREPADQGWLPAAPEATSG
jgi:hypothetical protein